MTAHTVALIDDDAAVRKALARLLRALGFTVTPFASAGESLADLCFPDDASIGQRLL